MYVGFKFRHKYLMTDIVWTVVSLDPITVVSKLGYSWKAPERNVESIRDAVEQGSWIPVITRKQILDKIKDYNEKNP